MTPSRVMNVFSVSRILGLLSSRFSGDYVPSHDAWVISVRARQRAGRTEIPGRHLEEDSPRPQTLLDSSTRMCSLRHEGGLVNALPSVTATGSPNCAVQVVQVLRQKGLSPFWTVVRLGRPHRSSGAVDYGPANGLSSPCPFSLGANSQLLLCEATRSRPITDVCGDEQCVQWPRRHCAEWPWLFCVGSPRPFVGWPHTETTRTTSSTSPEQILCARLPLCAGARPVPHLQASCRLLYRGYVCATDVAECFLQ